MALNAKELIDNLHSTAHGGMQKFSRINGKDLAWNFVGVRNGKPAWVTDQKDATGVACANKYYPIKAHLMAASRLRASREFLYAMVNRPVGIGTCPKDGLLRTENRPARNNPYYDMARNGIAVYSRRLSNSETKSFEMAYMVGGQDLNEFADQVIAAFGEYAASYLEIRDDDPKDFVQEVYDKLKSSSQKLGMYQPAVGNMEDFADLVASRIK